MFPAFQDTRECKLLKKINEAFEEENVEAFTEAVSLLAIFLISSLK
jgi:alpha-soluble NSF attachment protein